MPYLRIASAEWMTELYVFCEVYYSENAAAQILTQTGDIPPSKKPYSVPFWTMLELLAAVTNIPARALELLGPLGFAPNEHHGDLETSMASFTFLSSFQPA